MEKVKEIANAMKEINLLSSYDLHKERVLAYATKLIELYPDLKVEKIDKIMDDFFRGKKEFTPSKGIKNFTENIETVKHRMY